MGSHTQIMQRSVYFLFCIVSMIWPRLASGLCCQTKTASGVTYQLVSSTDPAPSFCLGGCIYSKENDPKPGTIYCFQEGDEIISCSGGDCQSTKGWIQQYFQDECSAKINTYLAVNVEEFPVFWDVKCGPPPMIVGADVLLFDNPICQGNKQLNSFTRPSETGTYSTADFFMKSESSQPWSVLVSKEGFQTTCKPIGVIKPFADNTRTIHILKEENINKDITPLTFVNFTFNINNLLLPEVFVQGNPNPTCEPSWKPLPGKPPLEDGKCFPTCTYSSWDINPRKTKCLCKGAIGGGIKFDNISLPNKDDPNGKASMTGSLIIYQEMITPKFYLAYADFKRRNLESIKLCESKLEVTVDSPVLQVKISKKVPCFSAQIPPATNDSASGPSTVLPVTNSTPLSFNDKLDDLESMFSEVDGVLVWGGGDRYWLLACQMVEIDFFTAISPRETPEFCGCIMKKFPLPYGVATKEQIKQCYIKALQDGPRPRSIPMKGSSRFNMAQLLEKNITQV